MKRLNLKSGALQRNIVAYVRRMLSVSCQHDSITRRLRDDNERMNLVPQTSARVAQGWLKYVALVLLFLTFGFGQMWGVTENRKVTLIFNSSGGTNSGTLQDSTCYITSLSNVVTDIVSFSANKGAASNVPAVYAELRFYKAKNNANGGSVTISAGSSIVNITRVDISAVNNYTRTSKYKIDSGSETAITWSSNAFSTGTISASSSFTIHLTESSNNTNQLRISQIVVYYTAEAAASCDADPTLNAAANNGSFLLAAHFSPFSTTFI